LGAEETKGGFTEEEIEFILSSAHDYPHVHFRGLMGMATNTDDETIIRADFERIARLKRRINEEFPSLVDFTELSIGMSSDWRIAVEYGATLVRIGSAIFGPRNY
ncbi:MAG: alanine racemase, partial [Bacteroidales bacterium]|nr:alanine racemase [Bacteroidales bacterium]